MSIDVERSIATHAASLRRALIIFGVVIVCLIVYGIALTIITRRTAEREARFEREIISNCRLLNRSHTAFDATLDQLAKNASQVLKPPRLDEALRAYRRLHLPQQNCPPSP